MGMASLMLKFKGTTLQEIPITKSPVFIGREHGNDIVLEDKAVSRRHARIFTVHNRYFIEDLNSANGIFVNNKKITKDILNNKDEVLVGKHVLVFVHEETLPSKAPEDMLPASVEETVVLNPKAHQMLMALRASKISAMAEKRSELTGSIAISSGGVYRERIALTKQTTVAGKSPTADIKLSGVFVGNTAFIISKKPTGFFITHSEGKRMTRVNGA